MNNLNYGVNVEFLLYDLSHHESSDIGEFEVYGDDDNECEGSASIDITLLAADALNIILSLKQELKVVTEEASHIKTMNDLLYEELRGYEKGCPVNGLSAEKLWHSNVETTVTDAYRNSILAEGVEMFIDLNRKLARDYPMAMVAKSLEVTELNGEQFAERLRNGTYDASNKAG